MNSLNIKALGGLLFLLLVMGALLFLPAWTLNYWQAWAFLAVFGVSALAVTLYLMKKDPMLLERRMQGGPTAEKEWNKRSYRPSPLSCSSQCLLSLRLIIGCTGRPYLSR